MPIFLKKKHKKISSLAKIKTKNKRKSTSKQSVSGNTDSSKAVYNNDLKDF